ncbi:MAG: GIY-YIG nuclease family protein [bacterium]
MPQEKYYNIYISTNHPRNTVLYVGVTNNIFKRESQHKEKINKKSFTARYNVNKVVYYETFNDIRDAITREKQIKAGSRRKKIDLINSMNPEWKDLIKESLE